MKRIILIIAAVALLANIGKAQDLRGKFHLGPKIGMNISNVYDTEGEEFKASHKFGWAAGVFLSLPIGPIFGIQPEMLFSQKGFKASGSILGNAYTFTRTLDYFDIPILIAYKPTERLSLMAGPQYSYLLKKKDVFRSSDLTLEQVEEFKNDNIRKHTLCFLGGFDINFTLITVGARIGWDLMQNNGDGTSSTIRYKNVWYQATFGYRFSQ